MDKFCKYCGAMLNSEAKCENCNYQANTAETENATYTPEEILNRATKKINELAGETGAVKLNIADLFSEVFHKHTTNEAEEIFISGTSRTTPPEKDISSTWPKPWLFSRVFIMFLATFALLFLCYDTLGNSNALPGMIFVGAIAVPISLVIFFMEVNAPRNISFFEVMKVFFVGGGASLVITLVLFSFAANIDGYTGAVITGIIEEAGKLIIIAYFLNKYKNIRFILSGILIGATVGAGFAAFETSGYILNYGLTYGKDVMMDVLILRAFLTPGGHVIWGAILGAALMLAKGTNPFSTAHLTDKKFISFFVMCVAMHSIWDMPIYIKYYLVQIAMTVIAWIIALVLIDVGLKEISKLIDSDEN